MKPFVLLTLLTGLILLNACQNQSIQTDRFSITDSGKGHWTVKGAKGSESVEFSGKSFAVTIDGRVYDSDSMEIRSVKRESSRLVEEYEANGFIIECITEVQEGWQFFSRQLLIRSSGSSSFKVDRIVMLESRILKEVSQRFPITGGKYGLSLRFKGATDSNTAGSGLFVLIQNPFGVYQGDKDTIRALYEPEMNWNPTDGAFPSDRLCMGTVELTGITYRQDMAAEWVYDTDPATFLAEGQQIDLGEIDALTLCTRAFLNFHPVRSARVHVGWCENDYQINMATAEGRTEYKRIIDQAAAVGCDYVLFTPDHSELAPLSENTDAWGWESLLFLNLGQKIRKGEWTPKKDPIPADVQDILQYAKGKNVKLLAYVYPSLPFLQNPEWTAWRTNIGQKPEGYLTVDTGLKSFQDWFVDLLVDFYEYTGIGGYSFDHWWTAYTDEAGLVSSKYQQWYGVRRILDELRLRAPEMLVDTRQQVHHFGTWTWLAGTYPHPMMSDEQPGSFNAIPDLSTDRVSAARQRYVAWRLMTRDFTPKEVLPGFITHQTQRGDEDNVMRRDRYRTRDWDYFGWKYNLLSSVATAPFNHVVNYLPARDEQEFLAFTGEDRNFFRKWMDFTDDNLSILRTMRPLIGQPMVGRCDGTCAILENRGFIFLFNPNYRNIPAVFRLDRSMGLEENLEYRVTELYPEEGMSLGHPEGRLYRQGDTVRLALRGTSARVFKIEPAQPSQAPAMFNCTGTARVDGTHLKLEGVKGLIGETREAFVLLTGSEVIESVTVNGASLPFTRQKNGIHLTISFAGDSFGYSSQIDSYNPEFEGDLVETTLVLPERVLKQVEARKSSWPVEYTTDDLRAPWTGPSRLLLYVQIAEPYRDTIITWTDGTTVHNEKRKTPIRAREVSLEINGRKVNLLEAYNGVYPYVERTNLGFYADITGLKPDTPYTVRLKLPKNLRKGQFQGLFLDHLTDEYTELCSDTGNHHVKDHSQKE